MGIAAVEVIPPCEAESPELRRLINALDQGDTLRWSESNGIMTITFADGSTLTFDYRGIAQPGPTFDPQLTTSTTAAGN